MSEHTERTSLDEVLQSSELAARLLRRLIASPGVIDTQRLYRTYARLTEVITHAHPLLHDLLARYAIDDDSTEQNLPLVTDQPWMLNVNTYLTNNNSYSSSSTSSSSSSSSSSATTTNNSFFDSTSINQSILQSITSSSNTSSSTNTQVFGTTSQTAPAPSEKFRISRRPGSRRESVRVRSEDDVLNPLPKLTKSLTSSMVLVEGKGSRLANAEDTKSEQEKQTTAFDSGLIKINDKAQTAFARTDTAHATSPTLTLVNNQTNLTRLSEKIVSSISEHQTDLPQKSRSVPGPGQYRNAVASGESRNRDNPSVIDAQRLPDATALRYRPGPTMTVEAKPSPIENLIEKPQFVWRKTADTQTLRDFVTDVSSSTSIAAVRQAIDSLPITQTPPPNTPVMKPESSFREEEPRVSEEITTEGMLRRISKMLLIERERRGY